MRNPSQACPGAAQVTDAHFPDDEQKVPDEQGGAGTQPNPGAQSGSYVQGPPTELLLHAPGVPMQASGATHPPGSPGGVAPSPQTPPAAPSFEHFPVWAAQ